MSRISEQVTTVPLLQLVQDLEDNRILIPPHQREFRWDLRRQQKFVKDILTGYPIPSTLMSTRRVDPFPTLEDGRQRITTALRYRSGKFPARARDGVERFYSELSEIEKYRFDNKIVMVMTYSNASDQDRIEIFDSHQNGIPLSPGERFHAQYATPLVSFVKAWLMTPGSGFHDRGALIWGVRGDPVEVPEDFTSSDKKRRWLLNAVALITGLSFGPSNMNKKYAPDMGFMTADFPPAKKAAVKKDLERVLEIYEAVNAALPARKPKQWVNALWDLGTFTGYIVYSLSVLARNRHEATQEGLAPEDKTPFEKASPTTKTVYTPNSLREEPEEWARLKERWVEYIVGVRTTLDKNPNTRLTKVLEECIHKEASKARNWTNERWENGYRHVFGLQVTEISSSESVSTEDDEDE